jgi:hypothetical protein
MTSNSSRRAGYRSAIPKEGEESAVRIRRAPADAREPEHTPLAGDYPVSPSLADSAIQRSDRIQRKLRTAKILAESLPVNDPRARLLQMAIVRRDEVLLDGVFSALLGDRERG